VSMSVASIRVMVSVRAMTRARVSFMVRIKVRYRTMAFTKVYG
jgi:hypothetical protein